MGIWKKIKGSFYSPVMPNYPYVGTNTPVTHTIKYQDISIDRQIVRSEFHKRVNQLREDKGLEKLELASDISRIAKRHSDNMADNEYFNHTNEDGKTPSERLQEGCNYDSYGENIAKWCVRNAVSVTSPSIDEEEVGKSIFIMLKESEPHYNNLISEDWSYHGIGVRKEGINVYLTQDFAF